MGSLGMCGASMREIPVPSSQFCCPSKAIPPLKSPFKKSHKSKENLQLYF